MNAPTLILHHGLFTTLDRSNPTASAVAPLPMTEIVRLSQPVATPDGEEAPFSNTFCASKWAKMARRFIQRVLLLDTKLLRLREARDPCFPRGSVAPPRAP